MNQYTVSNGGDVTRIVVWGGEDGDLMPRRTLRDALSRLKHVVVSCTIKQHPRGSDPFIGAICFRPEDPGCEQIQQLKIETTDSTVIPGLLSLFADIESGSFRLIGVDKQADANDFVNFRILFHKAGAQVGALA